MFIARLICSDAGCRYETQVEAATVPELECLACECGCGLAVVAWPDWFEEPGGEVVTLPVAQALRYAA